MGRRRRRKSQIGGAIKRKPRKQAKDGSKGGSDGADLVKRFGLEGEPRESSEELRIFVNMIKSVISRPDFDRDEFIRANNFSEEMIGFIDGMINLNKDEKLSAIVAIKQALFEGNLEEAKSLIDEVEKRYDYDSFMDRYQILEYEGKFEEALALCNEILTSKPSMYVIECKVEVLCEMGRIQEQLDLFDQWDAHFRDDPEFLAARG